LPFAVPCGVVLSCWDLRVILSLLESWNIEVLTQYYAGFGKTSIIRNEVKSRLVRVLGIGIGLIITIISKAFRSGSRSKPHPGDGQKEVYIHPQSVNPLILSLFSHARWRWSEMLVFTAASKSSGPQRCMRRETKGSALYTCQKGRSHRS
jgi:hypothetical protein